MVSNAVASESVSVRVLRDYNTYWPTVSNVIDDFNNAASAELTPSVTASYEGVATINDVWSAISNEFSDPSDTTPTRGLRAYIEHSNNYSWSEGTC